MVLLAPKVNPEKPEGPELRDQKDIRAHPERKAIPEFPERQGNQGRKGNEVTMLLGLPEHLANKVCRSNLNRL